MELPAVKKSGAKIFKYSHKQSIYLPSLVKVTELVFSSPGTSVPAEHLF
jgi:hypothetical protein